MSDKHNEHEESKRKTLKAILGGGGVLAGASALPDKWTKPLISSVILPAHAALSPSPTCATTFFVDEFDIVSESAIFVHMGFTGPSPGGEVATEVNLEFNDGEGEAQSYSDAAELSKLLESGVEFNIPTEAGSENEANILQINEVEVLFDFQQCEYDV